MSLDKGSNFREYLTNVMNDYVDIPTSSNRAKEQAEVKPANDMSEPDKPISQPQQEAMKEVATVAPAKSTSSNDFMSSSRRALSDNVSQALANRFGRK